jgi:hypothetical protein
MADLAERTITGRLVDGCFAVRGGVLSAARIPSVARIGRRISIAEIVLLFLCGSAAACAIGYVRLGLRIPGHAIVLAVVPMAFGLALAPRRLAGSVMSAGAFGTAALLTAFAGARYGSGSFVSLCLIGPMMDVALVGTRRGWRLYLGLVLAGIGSNFCALVSRTGGKLLGFDLPGTRPFGAWWAQALLTYTLCGAVAGLLGAMFWFQLRGREPQREMERRG